MYEFTDWHMTNIIQHSIHKISNIHILLITFLHSRYEDAFLVGRRRNTKNFNKFLNRKIKRIPYYGYMDKRPIHEVVLNLNWTHLGQILIAHGAPTNFCPKDFLFYIEYKYDTNKKELEQLFDILHAVDYVFKQDQMKYILSKTQRNCQLFDKVVCYVFDNNVNSLSRLCRSAIRKTLIQRRRNKSIYPSIFKLPLPNMLKDYLALKDCSFTPEKPRICLRS